MKLIAAIILALFLASTYKKATAQKFYKADSIYYLVDTNHVPIKDRMVIAYPIGRLSAFEIACPCLKNGQKPIIRYSQNAKSKSISTSDIKKIRLISLADLIIKIRQHFDDNFDGIQVYHIIEPEGNHYIMHEAGILPLAPKTDIDKGCCDVKKP